MKYLTDDKLLLSYTEFTELIKMVKLALSDGELAWLAEWEMLDLSISPMDDDQRRFMRYGHYLGWHAFQHSVHPTLATSCENKHAKYIQCGCVFCPDCDNPLGG